MDDPVLALKYYEIVLQNRQELGNEPGIAKILHNIALVHITLEEMDIALVYLERSLKSMLKINDKYGMGKYMADDFAIDPKLDGGCALWQSGKETR